MLQENPPADRWTSSWILDPYNQDKKVLMLDTDIPSNKAKLVKEEEERNINTFNDVRPCSI
jgi:hypothetical protein